MKKTNSQLSKLLIALSPNEENDSAKNYTLICDSTSCQLNVSQDKVEASYFCNEGSKTSIITNDNYSLTVSIDYDYSNPSHSYLKSLIINGANSCNNQFIRLEIMMDETQWTTLSGKSCIQFKSFPPSGGPTELAKIEFDIFPQDRNWVWGVKN